MKRVLFRVDGGKVWGVSMGHVFRCLAVAEHLKKDCDIEILFLMKDYVDGVEVVRSNGFETLEIDKDIDVDKELDIIAEQDCDSIVFDILDINKRAIKQLKHENNQLVVFDDTGNKEICSDVVVNGSIVEEYLNYSKKYKETKYLLGPDYNIIGNDFIKRDPTLQNKSLNNIAVFMGGTDLAGITLMVAKAIRNFNYDITFNFILGRGFSNKEEVSSILQEAKVAYNIIDSPESIASIFASSDLVILAGGRSLYEAAFMGLTGLAVPSIEHERNVTREFAKRDVFLELPLNSEMNEQEFSTLFNSLLTKLVEDSELREKMKENATQLIDGKGAKRVAEIIKGE